MKLLTPPGFYKGITHRVATVDVVHFGALTAMAGGLLWVLSGLLGGPLAGAPGLAIVSEAFSILALTGTAGGVAALHARQSSSYGWGGRLGFLAAFASSVVLLAGLPVSSVAGVQAPAALDLTLGAAFWGLAVGLLLLGGATVKLAFLPQWSGLLILISLPLAVVLGNYGGGTVFGASWIAIGYTLLFRHDVSAIIRARGNRA